MNHTSWQIRLLVPRWRSLSGALRAGELASPSSNVQTVRKPSQDLVRRIDLFKLSPDLITAAEIVEGSIVEGVDLSGLAAARYLLLDNVDATLLIKRQAASLLTRIGFADEVPETLRDELRKTGTREWRLHCRMHPYDGLAWVELALNQTVNGHVLAAERSMRVALQLAPNNRHVLRSAARFFLHKGDKERAHDLIARNAATKTDPWLIAAEISLAEVVQRDPRFFKHGLSMIESGGIHPRQITELAGAAATKELLDGSPKRSKRLFQKSMADPTGSSLAQGEWATPRLGAEIVPESKFDTVLESYEAKAFHSYRESKFDEVPELCWKWADVDLYSIRPFEFGSIAASISEDFEAAIALSKSGLELRPDAPVLLNSLAFALASTGEPENAELQLSKINSAQTDEGTKFLTLANRGLCAFRTGNMAGGKELYQQAVDGFRRNGFAVASAHARIYLAREALLAKLPEGKQLAKDAQEAMRPFPNSEAAIILRKVEIAAGMVPGDLPKHINPHDAPRASKPVPLAPPKPIKWVTPGWSPRQIGRY